MEKTLQKLIICLFVLIPAQLNGRFFELSRLVAR
jgi:hypothetical protein